MKTPYQLLGLNSEATDIEIKQAYLQKIKDNPPDKDQQQFLAIHNAYTSIKDLKSRISYNLFTLPIADFEQVIEQVLHTEEELSLTDKQLSTLMLSEYE